MPRGKTAKVGDRNRAPNGYWYQKTESRGWILLHWLHWEKYNGRHVNPTEEIIRFVDGNKLNFAKDNLVSIPKGTSSLRKKIARLESKIASEQAELEYLKEQLASESSRDNDS